MRSIRKRGCPYARLICLLTLCALLGSLLPACAQTDALWIETRFDSPGSDRQRTWTFPYRDDVFAADAKAYDHTLARSSLGLALSAFRSAHVAPSEQDAAVRAYLKEAGFSALVSQDYAEKPTRDTISTMIGSKETNGFTLVAVAVCGGGYGDEWLGNFTVGDAQRHVGFDQAAQKVQARVRDYLAGQGIAGTVKLWMTGYSRAAAVTNLAAADLTDSGLFADVFAYTFATPRATKSPGRYPNIFNIVGKFDPVTLVPLPEWGYGRNGVDLHTPAMETDSDYITKKSAADAVSRKLTGIAFFNNTEMNNTLRTILDYLLVILPDSVTYAEHMQDIMISVWKNRSLGNLSSVVVRMMEEEQLLDHTTKQEVQHLLDYLSLVTYTTVARQLTGEGGGWNNQTTALDNLAHEHSPDVYVCWLFSADDPGRLYSSADSYVRVTWNSTADASVFGSKGFLFRVDDTGRISHDTDVAMWAAQAQPVEARPLIGCEVKNGTAVATFPRDENYLIYLQATQDETMYYFGAEYRVDAVRADVDKTTITEMKKGEYYVIASLRDQDAVDGAHLMGSKTEEYAVWDEELPYSPSLIAMLQNNNVFHLTFPQMAMIAGAALMLLLVLLIWVIVRLTRRRRRGKRGKAAASDNGDRR